MPTRPSEPDLVRELARRVAELAAEPRMAAIKRRWRDVNALRRPDRAPVWCRPVGCWKELLPPPSLVCRDPGLRAMEYALRQILVKREIDDDTPVEPYWEVPAVFDVQPPNAWGVDVGRHESDEEGGAWGYDPPLREEADLALLRVPTYTYNAPASERALSRAYDVLGDVLPPRLVVAPPVGATLCNPAAALRGLGQIMLDMVIAPHLVHRLMALVRDGCLRGMDAAEATGLLTPNTTGPMTESDPIGSPSADGRYTLANCWCAANSQEFDQVSPAMWEAFLLGYQRPIFARYGLVAYGCCENLTKKIDGVLSIPNLRVFVCSAWTDLDVVLERVGTGYTIMWRQKAGDVVFAEGTTTIRRDLDVGLRRLRGRPYQIVLRELQTLAGHADRLHVWTRLAKELGARYS